MRQKQYVELSKKTYFGGKAGEGTYQKLINEFPAHDTYVAGFMGYDAVTRYKRPAKFNIGIEPNMEVVDLWRNATFTTSDITPSNLTIIPESFFRVNLPCFYSPKTLLYLDPPYTMEQRKSNHCYAFEITQTEHEQLLQRAVGFTCMVAISCYDNPLYKRVLEDENGWRKISFEVITRGGTMATETLYMNYAAVPSKGLHDVSFIGEDYRTREVLRKRLNTLHRKIEKLSPGEKRLLIEELLSKNSLPIEYLQK